MRDISDTQTQHLFDPLDLPEGSLRGCFVSGTKLLTRTALPDGRTIYESFDMADFDARR